VQVLLALRILRPCLDVLCERAVGKQMANELRGFRRADQDRRDLAAENPGRQHEIGEVCDVIEMQMRKEDHLHIDRIDPGPQQLMRRSVAAIEKIIASANGNEDGGMVAIGVDECRPGAEHDDPHGFVSLDHASCKGRGDRRRSRSGRSPACGRS
jgi:hypothetical protein